MSEIQSTSLIFALACLNTAWAIFCEYKWQYWKEQAELRTDVVADLLLAASEQVKEQCAVIDVTLEKYADDAPISLRQFREITKARGYGKLEDQA